MNEANLRIAVVEADRDRALMIVDSLRDAGAHDVTVIGDATGLARRLEDISPDVVLIEISNPNRDVLEEVALASAPTERPVAMFVDKSDSQMTRAAIEAGVSAYVVDGLRKERIKPVLDSASVRFQLFARMRGELETTKAALAERKVIDRAKGLLMKARGLSEEEAYALLRKTAMDQSRKVSDVAHALVTAADLLG
ncbi:MAG: ANTAR domain-containing response regulator [Paracoccaceae bacterium]